MKFIVMALLILTVSSSFSQVVISGKILSRNDSLPMALTSIRLMNEKRELVLSLMSDDNGNYTVPVTVLKKESSDYYFIFSGIAVVDTTISVKNILANAKDLHLNFFLSAKNNLLNNVEIISGKKTLQKLVDRWVLNPSNNLNAAGNNAFESLRLLPGTSISDEKIIVNGKSGVNYLINGQASLMAGANVVDLLKSLSPDQIERIELMTTPPAKYSAGGTAAVINIVLKKAQLRGSSLKVSSLYEQGRYSGLRNNAILGYKTPKFETNAFLNANFNTSISNGNEKRIYQQSDQIPLVFDNKYLEKHNTVNLSLYQVLNWNLNKKSDLNVEYQIANSVDKQPFASQTNITSNGRLDSLLKTHNRSRDKSLSYGINSTYQLKISKDKKLELNGSFFTDKNPTSSIVNNMFLLADGTQKRPDINNHINNDFLGHLYGISADYSAKTAKSLWELGAKISRLENNSDFSFASVVENSGPSLQTNDFNYNENTSAAYLSNTFKLDSTWSFKLGLRAEYSSYAGHDVNKKNQLDSSYLQLFPTFYVSKTISRQVNASFSYGRRILRPDFRDLNPFQYYFDPYSYIQGNPYLKPYFVNTFEGEISFFDILTFTGGYSLGRNVISDLTYQDDDSKIVYSTKGNIAKQKDFYSSISAQFDVFKFWNVSSSFNLLHDTFEGAYSNYLIDNKIWSWNTNLYNNFKLSKTWKASIGGWINGPSSTGIDTYKTTGRANVSFQKTTKRLLIQFGMNDIFNSQYERVSTRIGNQNIVLKQLHDFQRGWIKLTFNLDNSKKWLEKDIQSRKKNFEDDESRIHN